MFSFEERISISIFFKYKSLEIVMAIGQIESVIGIINRKSVFFPENILSHMILFFGKLTSYMSNCYFANLNLLESKKRKTRINKSFR